LIFPQPSLVERQGGSKMLPTLHVPGHARQVERLAPRFQSLQATFEARRLELQASAHNSDPDLVVVFETVGAVNDFISSAERIPGLEWLAGMIDAQVGPDEDFYSTQDAAKALSGKLFLMGSNRQALAEVVRLWELYGTSPTSDLGEGLNTAWKALFRHLKEVRFWGPQDRLDDELRQAWRFRLETGAASLKFEIEAWCFSSAAKNAASSAEVRALVGELGGRVLDERQILDIAYRGFLVEMPARGILLLLDGAPPPLLRSERVMFLRPQGQAVVRAGDPAPRLPDIAVPQQRTSGVPIVAMLDGLPLANHARLQGRLIVDDPNQWAETYPAGERVHGTAMASLIAWGELDGAGAALAAPIYARPILRPDPNSNPREECTPDDRLLVDLVHEAVRRMFEEAPGVPPAAPTVRVINLSVGDRYRPFAGELSPWARLLDWLSYKHNVLFIVSSGNRADDLVLSVARESLKGLTREAQASVSMLALMQEDMHRRLLSPAESVNALTVGAAYSDASTSAQVPGRFVLFEEGGVAPYSCIGPGFRRAIKPDILLPGGRAVYRELPTSPAAETHLTGVWRNTPQPPGQLVAAPPDASGDTIYTRGTSNAAALATRRAAQAFDVLEALRASNPESLPKKYDAVMIKALLAHGASLGKIKEQVLAARPDIPSKQWQEQRKLISRYAGYGMADVERALTCTEQRATMLGVGELRNDKAWEFRVPIPEALNATRVKRRLIVTLSWFTPTNARHSKYRVARLWVDVSAEALRLVRSEGEPRQLQLGTLQHETFESEDAVPVVPAQNLTIRVNCLADAGRLNSPVAFALCVSLEVAEGVALPIYQQVRARVTSRIAIGAEAPP
jgi:hypothetical protein